MKLTKKKYLEAVGLFTLAHNAAMDMQRAEKALQKVLGKEDQYGHCFDEVFEKEPNIDNALIKDGFELPKF